MSFLTDVIFPFLFKYPIRLYERGELTFAPVAPPMVLVAVGTAAIAVVAFAYFRVQSPLQRDRIVPATLRSLAIAVVILCLFRPGLVVASAVPQRNVLAVVIDDSRSMRISDGSSKESRLEEVQRVFGDSTDLMKSLSDKFALRIFRFSGDARPVGSASALTASGARSDLAASLDAVREELSGLPVAGVVLVSDGADNGTGAHSNALLALRARRIPVHTVGVGRERFERDVAIDKVVAPTSVLTGGSFYVDVDVRGSGIDGQSVEVIAEADGRILAAENLKIVAGNNVTHTRLRIPPVEAGNHRLTVRVRSLENERITENNLWEGMLQVRSGPDRILYVEGEPRPEFAFMRRAAGGDSGVHVVGLMRSAKQKYLRLGVADSLELVTGFPNTREELFRFRGVIIGSIEASFFTADQLRMLSEFVSQRGGTLLVLGGRSALGEGDYAGTALADVLPLAFSQQAADMDAPATEVLVRPTAAGLAHPALQLRATSDASRARWDSLPPLSTVNRVGPLRAGATLLLAGRPIDGGSDVPVFAIQRYGRGASGVLAVQDTWLWKMHYDIAVDDDTFQTFWRQILRWMVDGVPDRVDVALSPSVIAPGERVTVRAHVDNEAFLDVNGARVTAEVTAPNGQTRNVVLDWALGSDGNYSGEFEADTAGMYSVKVTAATGADTTVSTPNAFYSDEGAADLSRAELGAGLLRRIASETGGRYRALSQAEDLAEDVVYTESGVVVREAHDLWDMPAVFLLILVLLGAEWGYRRWRGLA